MTLAELFWGRSEPAEPEPAVAAPADRVQLGAVAKQLLSDPVLVLAFDLVAEDLVKEWRNSAVRDQETREAAYRMLWALEGAKQKLRAMLGNADLLLAEQRRRAAEEERQRALAA